MSHVPHIGGVHHGEGGMAEVTIEVPGNWGPLVEHQLTMLESRDPASVPEFMTDNRKGRIVITATFYPETDDGEKA